MTRSEMLQKLLSQSGWQTTDETDEDGSTVCRAQSEN